MLRCASCGHLDVEHWHFRRGRDCSACHCARWVHPVTGWLRHLADRVADRAPRRKPSPPPLQIVRDNQRESS